jgi:hypothetical protein
MSDDFKIVSGHVTGSITVIEHSQFNSISAKNVEVKKSVKARFFGNIVNLTVHEGARAWIHGSVSGKIENKGGRVFIFDSAGNVQIP